jgi:hypothetical protein
VVPWPARAGEDNDGVAVHVGSTKPWAVEIGVEAARCGSLAGTATGRGQFVACPKALLVSGPVPIWGGSAR